MIPYLNCEVYLSVLLYVITKTLCSIVDKYRVMHKQEVYVEEKVEDDVKWVPKKKHEVLKAKYKCLKKLFQIYDASVIGILPENYMEPYPEKRRKKRSKRTKTDAIVGTAELSNGDTDSGCSVPVKEVPSTFKKDGFTQDCKENVSVQSEIKQSVVNVPYREMRKPTRFQCFLQRIFGLNPDRLKRGYASDNDIICYERRRRGIRLRRRRTKQARSEMVLNDMKSPVILSYIQSVQRSCLMESTPRQCPISGCKMMFYGIINYNDHLNLCHFPERQYVCHYCHEGFTSECDKLQHENEHLGISRINTSDVSSGWQSRKIASVTQTDPEVQVPEDKLKKIVSFFDKITNPDDFINEIKKNRLSESNLETIPATTVSELSKSETLNLQKKSGKSSLANESDHTEISQCTSTPPIRCQLCGELFDNRRQLSVHIDVQHRANEKFTKFHSCAGIINAHPKTSYQPSEISNYSKTNTLQTKMSSLSGDPSTNVVYYTSLESLSKKSVINSLVQKVRSGFCYKWEPGTKIIRV
ncbi:uncharacterized protein LOC125053430 [Pieris napi]|uniref:uncharacterized protein LOC125053430 n=1 Tax=Pieris napi TaxID=78633 RepID=UPI001FBA94C1|nr:uncharacterized protein LOC125053430 [Pieris napi]